MSTRLVGNSSSPIEVNVFGGRRSTACAVVLSDGDDAARWRFSFYAVSEVGRAYVGSLDSAAPVAGSKTRVLGWVAMLHPVSWVVSCEPLAGTPAEALADVSILPGDAKTPGLFPNGTLSAVAYV